MSKIWATAKALAFWLAIGVMTVGLAIVATLFYDPDVLNNISRSGDVIDLFVALGPVVGIVIVLALKLIAVPILRSRFDLDEDD